VPHLHRAGASAHADTANIGLTYQCKCCCKTACTDPLLRTQRLLCFHVHRAGLSAKADEASKARLSGVLSVAVKAVTVAGLLAVTFGPPYSFTLLRVVYSQRWADTEAPFVLGCYTAYLLLLAVNGETTFLVCVWGLRMGGGGRGVQPAAHAVSCVPAGVGECTVHVAMISRTGTDEPIVDNVTQLACCAV
jgi:hypothetical protein